MSQTIPVDWEALETAVERNSPNTESYLSRIDGQVVTIVRGEPEAAALRTKVSAELSAFIRIEPASSREQYRWMERFVDSVSDEALRRRLAISIDGKGAFRRFKDVLLAYPGERERWFSYRANLLHWHIQNWMEAKEIEPAVLPPWGQMKEPEELVPADPETEAISAAPGESLRRQARSLIDGLEPLDLPSAIAFLEFLRARGRSAVGPPAESSQGEDCDDDKIARLVR